MCRKSWLGARMNTAFKLDIWYAFKYPATSLGNFKHAMGTIQSNAVIYSLCAKSNIWGHCIKHIFIPPLQMCVWDWVGVVVVPVFQIVHTSLCPTAARIVPSLCIPQYPYQSDPSIVPLLFSQLLKACCGLTLFKIPKIECLANLFASCLSTSCFGLLRMSDHVSGMCCPIDMGRKGYEKTIRHWPWLQRWISKSTLSLESAKGAEGYGHGDIRIRSNIFKYILLRNC